MSCFFPLRWCDFLCSVFCFKHHVLFFSVCSYFSFGDSALFYWFGILFSFLGSCLCFFLQTAVHCALFDCNLEGHRGAEPDVLDAVSDSPRTASWDCGGVGVEKRQGMELVRLCCNQGVGWPFWDCSTQIFACSTKRWTKNSCTFTHVDFLASFNSTKDTEKKRHPRFQMLSWNTCGQLLLMSLQVSAQCVLLPGVHNSSNLVAGAGQPTGAGRHQQSSKESTFTQGVLMWGFHLFLWHKGTASRDRGQK